VNNRMNVNKMNSLVIQTVFDASLIGLIIIDLIQPAAGRNTQTLFVP